MMLEISYFHNKLLELTVPRFDYIGDIDKGIEISSI